MTSVDLPDPLPEWLYPLSKRRSVLFSLSVTVACLALATAARAGLGLIDPNLILFATFYPAILAVTLLTGVRWGVATMVMGWLLGWYLFAVPRMELKPLGLAQILSMGLYAMSASLLIVMGEAYRRLLARLHVKRQRLIAEKEQSELLLRELNHRAKNTLTVISSIVRQSLSADRSSAERILGRLRAYASNDALLETARQTVLLEELIVREVASYKHQIEVEGSEVRLSGDVGQAISMVIHELTTNAVKHGALSVPDGTIAVAWRLDGHIVTCDWIEQGGPRVAPPERLGFGSFLIERLLQDHGGESALTFQPQGLACRLTFPSLRPQPERAAS